MFFSIDVRGKNADESIREIYTNHFQTHQPHTSIHIVKSLCDCGVLFYELHTSPNRGASFNWWYCGYVAKTFERKMWKKGKNLQPQQEKRAYSFCWCVIQRKRPHLHRQMIQTHKIHIFTIRTIIFSFIFCFRSFFSLRFVEKNICSGALFTSASNE